MKKLFVLLIYLSLCFPAAALATARTASVSGNWSNTATWGGTVPVDGDSVTINAGVNVLMDVDQGAFTGLTGLVITGGVTPGMLYFKNGTNGHLKMKTGYNITGTTVTNNGRLLVNSDGVWGNTTPLQQSNTAFIDLQGTSQIIGTNLSRSIRGSVPTILCARTYGTLYTESSVDTSTGIFTFSSPPGLSAGTAVMLLSSGSLPTGFLPNTLYWIIAPSGSTLQLAAITGGTAIVPTNTGSGTIQMYTGASNTASGAINVLDDVTSDHNWSTTVNFNAVVLESNGPDAVNYQRSTMTSITSSVITMANNLTAAMRPGALMWLSSRNVTIQNTSTGQCSNGGGNDSFQCEFRNSSASPSGYGVQQTNNSTFSNCTFTGFQYAITSIFGSTLTSCIFAGNSNGIYSSYQNTITSCIFAGCNSCSQNSTGSNFSACVFEGCQNAVNNNDGCGFNNCNLIGNNYGAYGFMNVFTGCNLKNNNYGVYQGSVNNSFINSNIMYNNNGIYDNIGSVMIGGILMGNGYDIFTNYVNPTTTTLSNVTTSNPIVYSGRNTMQNTPMRVSIEHYLGVSGSQLVQDAYGDILKINADGTGSNPTQRSGGGAQVDQISSLSNCSVWNPLNIFPTQGIRIWHPAGEQRTYTWYLQTSYANLSAGKLSLTARYLDQATTGHTATVTATPAITTRSGNSDWSQSISVTLPSVTQAYWATFNLSLMGYESGKYVWLDIQPVMVPAQ